MAIYTRFGSPVEIIHVDFGEDGEWVTVKYLDRAGTREVALSDLRADDGLNEIMEEIYRRYPEHNPKSEFYKEDGDEN